MLSAVSDSRTAFVSAGASGIGLSIAETLSAAGMSIIICDIDAERLCAARSRYEGWLTYCCDVGDSESVAEMFASIHAHHSVDILVNNAGVAGPTASLEDIDSEAWRECLRVSLDSHFYCAAAVVPSMKERRGGVIINIASTAGLYGFPYRSPYAAAKWAVCGLTKSWAMELGAYNIRVNAVAPGSVSGDRMDRVISAHAVREGRAVDDIRRDYCLGVSMGSFVEAREIADMVLFLCNAAHVSGQVIAVDGNTETLHVRN